MPWRAVFIVLVMASLVMPPHLMMSLPSLPPGSPRALAIPLASSGGMGVRQVRTRPVNMTLNVTSFSHRVLLRVNTTWLNATLLNVTVNGQVMRLTTGRHNLTFARYLDMIREYHGENVTLWRHVRVLTQEQSQEEKPAPPSHVDPSWLKYRWAFMAAIAAVMVGLKAGRDMKEARLKAKWGKLLKAKAMDIEQVLEAMVNEGEDHGDRKDMG